MARRPGRAEGQPRHLHRRARRRDTRRGGRVPPPRSGPGEVARTARRRGLEDSPGEAHGGVVRCRHRPEEAGGVERTRLRELEVPGPGVPGAVRSHAGGQDRSDTSTNSRRRPVEGRLAAGTDDDHVHARRAARRWPVRRRLMPVESWDRLVPCYLRVSRLLRRLRRRSRRADGIRSSTTRTNRPGRSGVSCVTSSLRPGARWPGMHPQSFWERAGSESHRARSVQRLIDRCTHQGPDDRADLAIRRLLRDPSGFRSGGGDRGAAYRSAWKVLRRYSGGCSDEIFAELQAAVLAHWPKEERDAYRFYHDRRCRDGSWGPNDFDVLRVQRPRPRPVPAAVGHAQEAIVARGQRSARRFPAEVRGGRAFAEGHVRGAGGGTVGSTIPGRSAAQGLGPELAQDHPTRLVESFRATRSRWGRTASVR